MIKQQVNVLGFLPISNLKRFKRDLNTKPNVILKSDQFNAVDVHKKVFTTGSYNFLDAKFQLPTNINLELFEKLAHNYWD